MIQQFISNQSNTEKKDIEKGQLERGLWALKAMKAERKYFGK